MKNRGSAYLETIVVMPLFLFVFVSISYFGAGYYISQKISELSKECLWFEMRTGKRCEGDFEIHEKQAPLIGGYSSSSFDLLNSLAGLRGIELIKIYKKQGFSDLKISSLNYSELDTWSGDTKTGKIIGYGLVLIGFIKGFSGSPEKIEKIGSAFLPEGFDLSRAERVMRGMGEGELMK